MKKLEIDGTLYHLPDPNTDGVIHKDLVAFLKKAQADELNTLACAVKHLAPDVQRDLMREAMKNRGRFDGASLEQFVQTAEGMEAFLSLLWKRHHPDLSLEQIYQLHAKASERYGKEYFLCDSLASPKS